MNIDNIFSNADLDREISKLATVKSFAAGTVILKEDGFIRSIPIVLKGILKVAQHDDEGNELVLYYIRPGESCVMSFMGGILHERSRVHAEIVEDAEIALVTPEDASKLVQQYPQWTDYFFRLYHKRFEELLNVVKIIAFENTEARILSLLAQKANLTGSRIVYTTHQQLAGELATSRVVVSRILKQLEQQKRLLLGRGYIRLPAEM